jgi:S-adenosylmethionine-diacylgycerolhomoserine-N-methlytransferase
MLPSTSPALRPEHDDPWALGALERFYGLHAAIYDWTRPWLLRGREDAVRALAPRAGERVLDVGCGTGWSLPRLAASGARVIGIEPARPMWWRALARLMSTQLAGVVGLDDRPYGSHDAYAGAIDAILFSYSLSMIPPFERVLERARADLRPGGRIAVVDFVDARGPVGAGLRRSHVQLGPARLEALRRLFRPLRAEVRSHGLWSYVLFTGERPD